MLGNSLRDTPTQININAVFRVLVFELVPKGAKSNAPGYKWSHSIQQYVNLAGHTYFRWTYS